MKNWFGGVALALIGAALWGAAGVAAQVLFQIYSFPPSGLVLIRSLFVGLVLLAWLRPKWPSDVAVKLLLYSLLGILPSQLFYYITISQSNVVTALLLQYLCLPMIVVYESLAGRFKLTRLRLGMIMLAIFGLLLVIAEGPGGVHLEITPIALLTGILSAFGVAYYTLFSRPLTSKYGSWAITGWSFLIVGLVIAPLGIPALAYMPAIPASDLPVVVELVIVVGLFGTLLSYGLLIKALESITSTIGSIAMSTEPVFAAVVALFVFGSLLSGLQYLGGALMLLSLVVLSLITPESKADRGSSHGKE